ncbi:MAG: fatty acid oxidation complex subunit alpha FadJ [Gemmatimonadales bacterium]|nr:MAG: fatty acid oxidation complex subunit alpha FadJ [Gemmatimonadales bacterium]
MNQDLQVLDGGLNFEVDRSHVGWLTFDQPGPLNVLSSTALRSLGTLVAQLESRIANGHIHALVIRSAKPGSFIAGADVREFVALESAAEAKAASVEGQRIFRRLGRLRVETIAVIDGTCLGGATELVLHCKHRVATDRPSTRIGLPEVRLGIIPGFGGTVRLPAVIGLQEALELILSGKPVSAERAMRIGLIDRVLSLHNFARELDSFIELVLSKRVAKRSRERSFSQRLLEGTGIGRRILFSTARKRIMDETRGMYPAPLRAIDVLEAAHGAHVDVAYDLEAEAVGDLLISSEAQSLVRVFLLSQQAKRALPDDVMEQAGSVRKAAVVGAGVMGGAIAQMIASNDVPVVLKDIDQGALDSGLKHAAGLFQKAVSARVFSEEEAGLKLALVSGTLGFEEFADVDLVIEAVVERLPIKQQVMREIEAVVPDDAVLATNTSSLSVAGIGSALKHPERFIGLHFFNPVHKMPLVEVIRPEGADPKALATGLKFVLDMGKTPAVVADQAGFLVNRLLSPYLNEAGRILADGASVQRIDNVLTDFGMPMGPLRLLDEIGFDVANHAGRELGTTFGDRLVPAPILARLMEDGRLGKKNGRGFYLYQHGRSTGVDPTIEGVARAGLPAGGSISDEDIRARCLYLMVNEAAWALDDSVVDSADFLDLAMIMGTGFPPFRGGLLRWADTEGVARIRDALARYESSFGVRFTPAPLLGQLADQDRTFTNSP